MIAPLMMVLATGIFQSPEISFGVNIYKINSNFDFTGVPIKTTKSGVSYVVAKQESVGKMIQSQLDNRRMTILTSARKQITDGKVVQMNYQAPRAPTATTYDISANRKGTGYTFQVTPSFPEATVIKVDLKSDEALLFIQAPSAGYTRRLIVVVPNFEQ